MPYNLRKRKAPQPEPTPKKPRKSVKDIAKEEPEKEDVKKVKTIVNEEVAVNHVKKAKKAAKEEIEEIEVEAVKKVKKIAKEKVELNNVKRVKKVKEVKVKETKEIKEDKVKEVESCNQLVFGTDSCGELGFGRIGFTKKAPVPIVIGEKIKQVSCGPMHTLSLTESGKVYAYGCNDEGALGRITDGDETLEATPTIVPLKDSVIKVTAGDSHSAALTTANEVFVWGNFRDEHGSVGLTPECDGKASFNPIQIEPTIKFTDMASGSNHMLLLDNDGNVYSFGVGAQGQLGRLKPEEIGLGSEPVAITPENRESFLTPKKVCLANVDPQRKIICDAVFAGNFSSFATTADKKKNRLAAWGLNNYYQLGYKGQKGQLIQHHPRRSTFTCSTSMINVACGQHHTLFLTRTGRVFVAGRHEYGMLGLDKADKEVCPAKGLEELGNSIITISAGINTSFAVSDDGKLYSWGMSGANLGVGSEDDLKTPTEVKSLAGKKVTSVSTGGSFTAVLVA